MLIFCIKKHLTESYGWHGFFANVAILVLTEIVPLYINEGQGQIPKPSNLRDESIWNGESYEFYGTSRVDSYAIN